MGVGYLTGQGGGGSNIKSVQRIYWSVPETTTSNSNYYTDFTISPVGINKSVIIVSPYYVSGGEPRREGHSASFVNSTTVRMTRNFNWYGPFKFSITVVEFNNVKSKQVGSTTMPSNNNTETVVNISAVNLNKSLVFASVRNPSDSAISVTNYLQCFSRLITATTIGLINDDGSGSSIVEWQVIEFK